MTSVAATTHLRLVGVNEASQGTAQRARQAVTAENRAAAANTGLDPTDPRWVLAVRAYSQLQGTALTFDRRQRLLRSAEGLGVRPFDANMIIAIVQDHARRGEPLSNAAGTVSLLAPPTRRRRETGDVMLRWIAAIASALTANAFLIWWLLG